MDYYLDEGAFAPEYAHSTDAGMDLRTPKTVRVPAHSSAIIDTGVHIQIPNNFVGFLKSKSGLNVKHGILSEGVIDCGYTGSIVAKLYNHSDTDYVFQKGDKIKLQMEDGGSTIGTIIHEQPNRVYIVSFPFAVSIVPVKEPIGGWKDNKYPSKELRLTSEEIQGIINGEYEGTENHYHF